MKTLTIIVAMVAGSAGLGLAQSQKQKLQSGDSIRVELERTTVSQELTQLRDSMNNSLKLLESRIAKAPAYKREKLETSLKEMIEYRDQVKLDIEETSITSRNAWTHEAVERIKANTKATRREYKRIRVNIVKL